MSRHVGAAVVLIVSCRPWASARTPSPPPPVEAMHLAPPPGTTLVQACTPTGPELCFNAIDDNCNGVIDEGCGEATGVLQFTIAWGSSPADVNLTVVTPGQERIPSARTRATSSGFRLDRDCPGDDGCGGQNVENVYFEGLDPPHGHYIAEIALTDLRGAETPVAVRFGARLGGHVVGFDVQLAPGVDDKKTFGFDLP